MSLELAYPHVEKLVGRPARLVRVPRVRVAQLVMDYLAHGWSVDEMCRQYPCLSLAEAHAAMTYEDGSAELPDQQLLERAHQLSRLLFTQDIRFKVLAEGWQRQGRAFSGLLFGHQLGSTDDDFSVSLLVCSGFHRRGNCMLTARALEDPGAEARMVNSANASYSPFNLRPQVPPQ